MNFTDICVWAKYTMLPNGDIAVNNSAVDLSTGVRTFSTAVAAVVRSGELDVQFYLPASSTAEPNYIVLDTDYTGFGYSSSSIDLVMASMDMTSQDNCDY